MTMPTFMTLDRIFIAFMTVCGLIFAGLVILFPQSRNFGIPPYFWVLIVMGFSRGWRLLSAVASSRCPRGLQASRLPLRCS
jgi:hypothetical protein